MHIARDVPFLLRDSEGGRPIRMTHESTMNQHTIIPPYTLQYLI